MKERVEQIVEGVNSLKINEKQTLEYWEDIADKCDKFQFRDHSEIMMFLNDAYTNMYQIAANYKAQNNTTMVSKSFEPLIDIINNFIIKSKNHIGIDIFKNSKNVFLFLKDSIENVQNLSISKNLNRQLQTILKSFQKICQLENTNARRFDLTQQGSIQHAIRDVEVGGSRGR